MVRRGQPTLAYPANTPSGPRPLLGLEPYAGGLLLIPVLAGASSQNNATFSAAFSVKDANCLGICQSM